MPIGAQAMLQDFARMLQSLSRLAGLSCCVHDLTSFTRVGGIRQLPSELAYHSNPFCTRVKCSQQARCFRQCQQRTNQRVGRLRRPLVKRCHAGVTEVAVPVLVNGNHAGTIFLGPVVETARPVPAGAGRLPRRSRRELAELGELAQLLAGHLAGATEARLLREVQAKARSTPVRRALAMAEEFHARPLTIQSVARETGLSPSRLAHCFSAEVGTPFHQYLTALRLNRAKALLRGSSLPVGEIAQRTGFCNQNHFSTVFSRAVGVPPAAYRHAQQDSVET